MAKPSFAGRTKAPLGSVFVPRWCLGLGFRGLGFGGLGFRERSPCCSDSLKIVP